MYNKVLLKNWLIDWVISMLRVSRFRLVEVNVVEVFDHFDFHFFLLSSCKISSSFRENNNMIVFLFPFHIFMPFANLCLIRLQGQFPILRIRSYLDFYPLIRLPRRPLALGRERILISGFIRFPPMLAVYDGVHKLQLGGVGRGFSFTEDETRRHTSLLL